MSELCSAGILGTGHYAPEKILSNADLERMVDTSDEWIRTRTGIETRHIASRSETTSDLCVKAALPALEMAGLTADDIDWALSARTQVIDGLLMSFFSPGAILPAAAVFVAVKERVARHPLPEKLRLPLHRAAGCTMGAYLIHPLVKMVLQNQLHFTFESLPQ